MDQNTEIYKIGEQSLLNENIKIEPETFEKYEEDQDPLLVPDPVGISFKIVKKEEKDIKEEKPFQSDEDSTNLQNTYSEHVYEGENNTTHINDNEEHINKRILRSSSLLRSSTMGSSLYVETNISVQGRQKSSGFYNKWKKKKCSRRRTSKKLESKREDKIFTSSNCNGKPHSDSTIWKSRILNYKCVQCNKTFANFSNLKRHSFKLHKNFKFDFCNQQFSQSGNMKLNNILPSEKKYVCENCGNEFIKFSDLRDHINAAHYKKSENSKELNFPITGKVYACASCDQRFSLALHLKKHIVTVHLGIGRYKCVHCCKIFSSTVLIRKHARLKHNCKEPNLCNSKYACDKCDKTYAKLDDCKSHIKRVHLGILNFKCEQCNITLCSLKSLERHNNTNAHKNFMKFECKVCKKKFSHLSFLAIHEEKSKKFGCEQSPHSENLKQHSILHGERKYVCDDCGNEFIKFSDLRDHINAAHYQKPENCKDKNFPITGKVYACASCDERFSLAVHLKKHIKNAHLGIGRYKCVHCVITFSQSYRLRRHARLKHNYKEPNPYNSKYACGECDKTYYKLDDCKNHIRRVHLGIIDYRCEKCNKTLSSLKTFNKHITTDEHKNFKEFECKVCKKKFSHLSVLKQHMPVHQEKSEKFVCDECGKKFFIYSLLQNHINRQHLHIRVKYKQKKKVHTCGDCGKEYSSFWLVKGHITTVHLGIGTYKCEQCNKTYLSYTALKTHYKSEGHKNFKKIECEYCNKKFSHLSLLKLHIGVHTKTRKYVCGDCGKSFFVHGSLKQHMNTSHIKSKDYQCEHCGKAFVQKGQLEQHINLIHKKLRDYECRFCYKKFQRSIHLQNHIICVHEKIKNFVCEQCGDRFLLAHHLRNHIKYVHKGISR